MIQKIISLLALFLLLIGTGVCQEFSKKQAFRGKLNDPNLQGYQIAAWPLVKHATSFEIDEKGRFFSVESDRLNGGGVLDIRSAKSLTAGDFRLTTTEDRRKQLLADKNYKPGFFSTISERVARLEDLNGDGIPDRRTEYASGMNDVLDGVAFSALAIDGSLYLTCIPNLWKFVDTNDDGVADSREKMFSGFGVRTSMMGHDLHGIIRGPDGKLYWSVGDRGYNVTSKEGENFAAPSRGAIFRCELDGSNFEVFHHGLRNPQELAFDSHGNLFTFDNTGDIGDRARVVYVLEGADSGWFEEHQGPHQYRSRLDFADIAIPSSIWVSEKMFAPRNDIQPQWILPPIANAGNGPSGVVFVTGESLPQYLRESFLVCNYRGNAGKSQLLSIKLAEQGAGFKVSANKILMSGVANSDVELGYDGRIYALDFGGGWKKNNNASIQAIESPQHLKNESVKQVQTLFHKGFKKNTIAQLAELLKHPDMRLRQRSQFELVRRKAIQELSIAATEAQATTTRLHGIWGLAQLAPDHPSVVKTLINLAKDSNKEVRANTCRSLGDLRTPEAVPILKACLADASHRVRSLAAIALGKCGTIEDAPAIWNAIGENAGDDIWLRQAGISALMKLGDERGAQEKISSSSEEERLCAVVLLRRLDHPSVAKFLKDPCKQIQVEAIRAVYDKHIQSGFSELAQLSEYASQYSPPIQRRILFANFWLGRAENADRVMAMARDSKINGKVGETALRALIRWNRPPSTDPVTALYRPSKEREISLLSSLAVPLRQMIQNTKGKKLSLALELAKLIKLPLAGDALEAQIFDPKLDSSVRVAALNTMANQSKDKISSLVEKLKNTDDDGLQAARLKLMFKIKMRGRVAAAKAYLSTNQLLSLRTAIKLLAQEAEGKKSLVALCKDPSSLAKEAHLDLYLTLSSSDDAALKELASQFAPNPSKLYNLSLHGGDPLRGSAVFKNQGACIQCHMVKGYGGGQGPALDAIGKRLSLEKLLESVVNPNAEIADGYGMLTLTMNSGEKLSGRLGKEDTKELVLILPNGQNRQVPLNQIKERKGPFSAMPAMGAALQPKDLRDLISYLSTLRVKNTKNGH